MADSERGDQQGTNLHLTPEERRLFGHLFALADAEKIGVVTGERAVSFFERTRLSADVLGEIWQIADAENRGLLTPAGFGIVLRLIGYAQAGRPVSQALAYKPGGPLPRFDGIAVPPTSDRVASPLQAQNSGPIRVPPLTAERVSQYSSLFEESGAQNGVLPGDTAKSIFERSQLSNEALGRIWTLADTEQKGSLVLPEFVIAMHLMASMKNGSMRALPQILPAGLYEAASRRGAPSNRVPSRPTSDGTSSLIPRQFSGPAPALQQRQGTGPTQTPGADQWAITLGEKAQFDAIFATVDTQNRGFITGDQAVGFFSNSRLSEDALAQIWDLADINSEGQLNKDEFAVAMYLIKQQRSKTAGRDVLPQQLPPSLVPPSMRRQPIPSPQPTAPAFDNTIHATAPRSASEDLFGLDAAATPPPVGTVTSKPPPDPSTMTTPTRSQASSSPAPGPGPTHFKPFIPSSSFGQAIMSPQDTGNSVAEGQTGSRAVSAATKPASAADDLLGDNDPEVSSRLTSETSDLANLSNQVSSLTGQMQSIKSKRGATEQEFGQAQAQKKQFESRLSELRTAYEQEAREVRALEEQLKASKSETAKLQSDIAMIEGTYEDLKVQHRQASDALTADQNENASLKERTRQTSLEIENMKPILDKVKSDARHQRGLVAINKKQLATQEAEREKIKKDIDVATEEHTEASRGLEESQMQKDVASPSSLTHASDVTQSPGVSSPAPSTASMNPFFRRTTSNAQIAEKGDVSTPFTPPDLSSPNHTAFDNFFASPAQASTPPPPTSFRSDSPKAVLSEPTVSTPPTSTLSDSLGNESEPPAPPQSRQITSSFLPLRPNLGHSESESSSIKVIPPASRIGERVETASHGQSEIASADSPNDTFQEAVSSPLATNQVPAQFPAVAPTNVSSSKRDVPGAFPGDETPVEVASPADHSTKPFGGTAIDPRIDIAGKPNQQDGAQHTLSDDPFSQSTSNLAKDDFDSAFDGFDSNKGKAPEAAAGDPFEAAGPPQSGVEFPPIKEIGDESDSESDHGFDDHFTTRSGGIGSTPTKNDANNHTRAAPPFDGASSNEGPPPTPGAQSTPPTYSQTVETTAGEADQTAKPANFPADYSGLLPSREPLTSPPTVPLRSKADEKASFNNVAGVDRGLNFFPDGGSSAQIEGASEPDSTFVAEHAPMAAGASTAAPFAFSNANNGQQSAQSQPPVPPKAPPKDDFDFDDLAPAQDEDERGDETLNLSHHNTDLDFNPTFDTPKTSHTVAASQSSNIPPPSTSESFNDFQASTTSAAGNNGVSSQPKGAVTHDWDAIFASLDSPPQTNGTAAGPSQGTTSTEKPSSKRPGDDTSPAADDDPILKRLIGMGFARSASLQALEKYDYNIDKAAEFLLAKA